MVAIVYKNANDAVEEEIRAMSMNSLYRVRDVADTVFRDASLLAAKIALQPDVKMFMTASESYKTLQELSRDIYNTITLFTHVNRHFNSIYIYSEEYNFVISDGVGGGSGGPFDRFPDIFWHESYIDRQGSEPWVEVRKKQDIYPYVISIFRPVYFHQLHKLGVVIINIDTIQIGRLISRTGNPYSENIFIIDEDGTILYNNDRDLMIKSYKDTELLQGIALEGEDFSMIQNIHGERVIISKLDSQYHKWHYVSILPLNYYQKRLERVGNYGAVFLMASIVIAVLVSFIISVRTYAPVKNILSVLDDPQTWKKEKENILQLNIDETKYIAGSIINTIYSNQQLHKELEDRLVLLNKAQTAALQAQINPHFLYNTLEIINWSAIRLTNEDNDVSEMVTALSELLRSSLSGDGYLNLISDEINHAKNYINIMKVRNKDKFDVTWQLEEEVLNFRIVKITFQPIIENAIYHGFKNMERKGTITIQGRLSKKDILFEICDDGIGMSGEFVEELNRCMETDTALEGGSIGICNVNQRIKLVFGDSYGITVSSREQQGTRIEIRVPQIL